jgi:hypothetical protein
LVKTSTHNRTLRNSLRQTNYCSESILESVHEWHVRNYAAAQKLPAWFQNAQCTQQQKPALAKMHTLQRVRCIDGFGPQPAPLQQSTLFKPPSSFTRIEKHDGHMSTIAIFFTQQHTKTVTKKNLPLLPFCCFLFFLLPAAASSAFFFSVQKGS